MSLLEAQGIRFPTVDADLRTHQVSLVDVHGTTVIAVKFDQGVLNVADRRATAGNAIFYEEAEKILKLDDETLIAIAGSYAAASEAVRFLQHSFKYYARSQLQEMSLEGKLHEVSRVLGRALPGALQGIGGFLPIVSAFDREKREGRIFFYDAMGARFESREFGAAGSGAERIRGAFEYIVRTKRPFRQMKLEEALRETLLLLEIAASLDTATSGIRRLPSAKTVTADGVQELSEDLLRALQRELLTL
ncbi:MAG: proteasome subunit alpha [Candidatus Bipolaricaulota bacterium]|nr:proteasome subunit alpha [Candidatus Bipolaricaulota bacterium]MCS7274136.1 proteasome subunit alpha [Candidatus Bipolaricaulota bacterium]MDW8111309.1 proteasome subunit alpha [Candidatus Bipolaricaulota bacterium]MDW8328555.1 proteasome subunit alpha [Candidatus Bipolaricaulota bacterium]